MIIYNDLELDVISRGLDIEQALARAIEDQEIVNDMNDTDWADDEDREWQAQCDEDRT